MRLPWIKKEERAQIEVPDNEAALLKAVLAGVKVSKEIAEEIPAVAASVSRIAESVSSVEWKLYELVDGVPKEKDDRRTYLLNQDPGDTLDSVQFWRAAVKDYYLDKGGYVYINRKGNEVESLHYVEAGNISFLQNADPIFKSYSIQCNGKTYYPYEFMKILRNTANGWKGKSIVDENPTLLWVAYSELKLEGNQLSKGGNKKGFLQSDHKLDQSAIDTLKAAFRSLYSNNSDNVVVLNKGLSFKESSNTSVEMQLKEMKEANDAEIYRLFHIPTRIMTGGATDDDIRQYNESAVRPPLDAIKNQLNRLLLLEDEKTTHYWDYDMSPLMKGDVKNRYAAYKMALESGFLTLDEVRKRENNEPIGLPFVKLNLADVLYDPTSKVVYAVNTGKGMSIEDLKKGGTEIDES